jgi:hypothetical protein
MLLANKYKYIFIVVALLYVIFEINNTNDNAIDDSDNHQQSVFNKKSQITKNNGEIKTSIKSPAFSQSNDSINSQDNELTIKEDFVDQAMLNLESIDTRTYQSFQNEELSKSKITYIERGLPKIINFDDIESLSNEDLIFAEQEKSIMEYEFLVASNQISTKTANVPVIDDFDNISKDDVSLTDNQQYDNFDGKMQEFEMNDSLYDYEYMVKYGSLSSTNQDIDELANQDIDEPTNQDIGEFMPISEN